MVTPWSPTISNPRWLQLSWGGDVPALSGAAWKGCEEAPLKLVAWFPCCRGGCQASAPRPSTQQLPGICRCLLSHCRQRRTELALVKHDSAN